MDRTEIATVIIKDNHITIRNKEKEFAVVHADDPATSCLGASLGMSWRSFVELGGFIKLDDFGNLYGCPFPKEVDMDVDSREKHAV